jgi:GH24 family phage-related lysozyme (muramidase)
MKISQEGVDLIKKYEGLSLKAYKVAGANEKYWTIGYGHYSPDVKEHDVITKAKAEELLKSELHRFEVGVEELVTVGVNQHQFDALVSFSYNLGLGTLKNSTLLKLVNGRDFKEAAKEFDKFVHAGGNVLKGLVTRRNDEQALFLKAVPVVIAKSKKAAPKKYTSLVDYLNAHNLPSDYQSRFKLATKHGIHSYVGHADDNLKLLKILQK